jgi:hypothetical protein
VGRGSENIYAKVKGWLQGKYKNVDLQKFLGLKDALPQGHRILLHYRADFVRQGEKINPSALDVVRLLG